MKKNDVASDWTKHKWFDIKKIQNEKSISIQFQFSLIFIGCLFQMAILSKR